MESCEALVKGSVATATSSVELLPSNDNEFQSRLQEQDLHDDLLGSYGGQGRPGS